LIAHCAALSVFSTSGDDVITLRVHRKFVNRSDIPAFRESSSNERGHIDEIALAGYGKVESGVTKKSCLPAVSGVETLKSTFCGASQVFVESRDLTEWFGSFRRVLNDSGIEANS
jgi:hypothetical protein